jgi:hypothetical protein
VEKEEEWCVEYWSVEDRVDDAQLPEFLQEVSIENKLASVSYCLVP